jgi:hypothetical protein
MWKRALWSTVALVAVTTLVARAEPKDDLKAAVKKLADSPNYSWSTTTQGGFGNAAAVEGKTEKDGVTHVTLPMMNESYEVYMKGAKALIKTADGWKTAEELAAAPATAPAAGGAGPGGGRGRGAFNVQALVAGQVQAFQTPAAQAQSNVDKLENVKATADGFTADLPADSAKEMMAFGRGRGRGGAAAGAAAPEVKNPKATVKVTLKDGTPAKVEYHVTGAMSFNGNDIDIDRTTTTDIKDVGTTKVTVPDDVKAKL